MIDLPDPVVGALVTICVAIFLGVLTWSARTVRRANVVVGANDKLKEIVATQTTLIQTLQEEVKRLNACLTEAEGRIAKLEGVLSNMEIIERLHPARRRSLP
jgi:hypothetical protein